MAQGVAFQALLSFVPFVLLVASFWGHWMGGDTSAAQRISDGLRVVLPFSAPVINRSFDSLMANKGLYTALSLGALLWLAGSVFRTIDYAINLAFETQEERGQILAQVKGVVLVFLFGILIGVWVISRSVVAVVANMLPDSLAPLVRAWQGLLMGTVVPVMVLALIFTALYHRLPHRPVAWRDALYGGIITSILFHGALRLFGWALRRTLSYNLLSGTVAAVVGFLIWSYWASCIFLYGAALVAVRGHGKKP